MQGSGRSHQPPKESRERGKEKVGQRRTSETGANGTKDENPSEVRMTLKTQQCNGDTTNYKEKDFKSHAPFSFLKFYFCGADQTLGPMEHSITDSLTL